MKPATNRIEDALVSVTILRSHADIPRLSISPSRSAHNASNARHSTSYIAHCGIQPQTNLGEYTLDLLWIQSEYNDTRPSPYHDRRCGFSLKFPALVSPYLVIRSGFPIPSLSSLSSPPSPSTRPSHCPVPGFLNLLQGHFDAFELGCVHCGHVFVAHLASPFETYRISHGCSAYAPVAFTFVSEYTEGRGEVASSLTLSCVVLAASRSSMILLMVQRLGLHNCLLVVGVPTHLVAQDPGESIGVYLSSIPMLPLASILPLTGRLYLEQ